MYLTILSSGGKRIEYFLLPSTLSENGWENIDVGPPFGHSLADDLLGSKGPAQSALTAMEKDAYDILLINQGESNFLINGDEASDYAKELSDYGVIDADTLIIAGGISPKYRHALLHKDALHILSSTVQNFKIAEWEGVSQIGPRNYHADGPGLEKLGEQYFKVASQDGKSVC